MMEEKKYFKYILAILAVYFLIYYIPYWLDGMVLKADDFRWTWVGGPFWNNFVSKAWNPNTYLGAGADYTVRMLNPTDMWLAVFSPKFATNTLYVFMFSLLIWSTYLFFRSWGVTRIPSLIVGIFTAFSPIFHTFIRTGHMAKMMLSPMIMFAFAFITYFFRKSRYKFCYTLLSAVFLSFSFGNGDPQVFLYFAPFFSLYAVGLFFLNHHDSDSSHISQADVVEEEKFFTKCKNNFLVNRKLFPQFILIAVLAGFLSIGYISNYIEQLNKSERNKNEKSLIPLSDQSTDTDAEAVIKLTPEEEVKQYQGNWFWATQWSLPKIETIDLFVPGFMGYLSGSPTEPYWGRQGQTEGWDEHRQGYQNYSLVASYLGVFFTIFLVYGLVFSHLAVRITGAILLVIFMLLSYGKFSFLYEWLYQIPYMKSFRNPNRFLQLVHFTGAIVSGFGFFHYYERIRNKLDGKPLGPFNFFLVFLAVVLVIGVIGIVGLQTEESQLLAYFSDRFSIQTASLIVSNMNFYWIKAVVVFSLACLLLHYATKKISKQNIKIWAGVILIFGLIDLYVVNKKFYWFEEPDKSKPQQTSFHVLLEGKMPGYEKYGNDDPLDPRRMYFLKNRGGFKGQYIKYLFYNGGLPLVLFDFNIVRKTTEIPQEFNNYYQYLNNNDLRFLKLAGVRYLFTENPVNHPGLRQIYVDEIPSLKEKVYLYQMVNAFPIYYFRGDAEFGNDVSSILGRMNEDSFDIDNTVMLHEGVKEILSSEQIGSLANNPANTIKLIKKEEDSSMILETDLKTPVILVLNYRYHNGWKAMSGDKVLPHFPANYYFNGFYLTPNDRQVKVEYVPKVSPKSFLGLLTLFNYLSLAGVIIFLIRQKDKKKKHRSAKRH